MRASFPGATSRFGSARRRMTVAGASRSGFERESDLATRRDRGTQMVGGDGRLRVLASPAYGNIEENPYTWLLYSAMRELVEVDELERWAWLRKRYDVFHVHWPEHVVASSSQKTAAMRLAKFAAEIAFMRLRGTVLVWTVHNIGGHEPRHRQLERLLYWLLLRQVDGVIHLSAASRAAANRHWPRLSGVPNAVVRHGLYESNLADIGPGAAKEPDVDERTPSVLYFGRIRPYKGIDELLRVYSEDASRSAWRLTICGAPDDKELSAQVARAARKEPGLKAVLRHVDAQQLHELIRRSALVCLPYRSVNSSGAAMLALSVGCPVLVPESPMFQELRDIVGPAWVRVYKGRLGGRSIEDNLGERPETAPNLDAFQWPLLASQTAEFLQTAVRRRRRNRLARPPRALVGR